MKFSIPCDQFVTSLGVAARGVSTRSAIQTLSGVLVRARRGSRRAPGHRHGARHPGVGAGEGGARRRGGRAGPASARRRPVAAEGRALARVPLLAAGRRGRSPARRSSTCARFRSRTSRSCPSRPARTMRVPSRAFVETINRVARSASRDETRPHLTGVLVSASGKELRMVATDSYRLSVKETSLEQPLDGELEANVPARTLQELGRIAGHRGRGRDRDHGAREPGRLQRRRDGPLLAAGRRSIPELSPAPARDVRARTAALDRRAARGRAADQPAGAEERAAADGVQRGRARGVGADAGRGRGQRVAAGARSRASRSRSASTRSSSATASRARSRTSSSSS